MAAARRRRELDDGALCLLADRDHSVLDVHGTSVTGAGVTRAAGEMPDVRYLDARAVPLSGSELAEVAELCPQIEVLRLGALLLHVEQFRFLLCHTMIFFIRDRRPALFSSGMQVALGRLGSRSRVMATWVPSSNAFCHGSIRSVTV